MGDTEQHVSALRSCGSPWKWTACLATRAAGCHPLGSGLPVLLLRAATHDGLLAACAVQDLHFESAESGASLTYPQQAGTVRKNGFLVIKGRPCKVGTASRHCPTSSECTFQAGTALAQAVCSACPWGLTAATPNSSSACLTRRLLG